MDEGYRAIGGSATGVLVIFDGVPRIAFMFRPHRTTRAPHTAGLSLTLLLTGVLASPRAHANDSSALLEAGGIVFTVSKDVSMESEALWISRRLVRVAYVFKNTGPADVKTTVAFPVPGLPRCEDENDGECDGDIQIQAGDNPMAFKVRVDGREVAFKTKQKTKMSKGVGTIWYTHHWEQVFPKDKPVRIEHEYVPIAGGFFTSSESEFEKEMSDTYCVGPKLFKALSKQQHYVWAVHYILTTGANWKGPIKSFKLTIAKESPDDKVSVCLPDTRRTSPTTFEVVRENFTPTQDLKLLFINAKQ